MTSELTDASIIETSAEVISTKLWETDLDECERRWTHESFLDGQISLPGTANWSLRTEMINAMKTLPDELIRSIVEEFLNADICPRPDTPQRRLRMVRGLIVELRNFHGPGTGTTTAGEGFISSAQSSERRKAGE